MKNSIFWAVDCQNDFVNADGALAVPEAESLIGNLTRITKYAKFKGLRVVNTKDDHDVDSAELSDTPDFINTFPPHCMNDTDGSEFIGATLPEDPFVMDWREKQRLPRVIPNRNVVLFKDKFNAFTGNKQTDDLVKKLKFKKVFVYGVATNVCVHEAVMGLVERGKEVYVFEDAIMGLPGIPSPVEDWIKKGVNMIRFSDVDQYLEQST